MTSCTSSTGTSTRWAYGCPGWAPRLRPEGGQGGLRLTCGPSDDGGREGVLRILLELRLQRRYLRLQGGNALLVPLHHQPEHRLALRWNPVPQFLGQRRLSSHGTGLHIRATAFTQVWDLNGHRA